MSRRRHDSKQSHFTFVLGKVHGKIGGPTRTIWGYISGLTSDNSQCTVTGIGSDKVLEENFSHIPETRMAAISGGVLQQTVKLISLYWERSPVSSMILVVGVWHLPFFVLGGLKAFQGFFGFGRKKTVILVPTMSLTEYDWAKHPVSKRCLRPLVAIILRKINGVVFASSGEMELSGPSTWSNATVILHPTVTAEGHAADSDSQRDIDVLFVGRLDPQKDIPLLLGSFSKMSLYRRLDIVGDGDEGYVAELSLLAENLGIADRVTWHGWKSHSETLDIIRRARAVAVTSIVENYCHVAVEALVSGCELVLVDRVMSAADFARLADIDVVGPDPRQIAERLDERLSSWSKRSASRAAAAVAVREACGPASAAAAIREFANDSRSF